MSDEVPTTIPADITPGIIQGEFMFLDSFHAGFGTAIVEDQGAVPCLILGMGFQNEVLPVLIPGPDVASFFNHLHDIEGLWNEWMRNPTKFVKEQEAEMAESTFRTDNDDK